MTAPTLDGQAICASNWAYAIAQTGPVPVPQAYAVYASGAGLRNVCGVATGSSRIDAAFVGTGANGVVLAFRGTLPPSSPDHQQTLKDWLNDLEFGLVSGDKLPGRVHHGFLGALDSLWAALSVELAKQLAASPVKRLLVTGHSKGGAMAHLAAARIALCNIVHGSDITVRSFEGAHPGDAAFADAYQRQVGDVLRYEFTDDLVPHLPPSLSLRHLFDGEPLFEPLMASGDAVDYAPAGKLCFLDWDGKFQDDSPALRAKRLFHLATRLASFDFETVVHDHSIGIGTGMFSAVCPTGVP